MNAHFRFFGLIFEQMVISVILVFFQILKE